MVIGTNQQVVQTIDRCTFCHMKLNIEPPYVFYICRYCGTINLSPKRLPSLPKRQIASFYIPRNGSKTTAENEERQFADLATVRRLRQQKIEKRKFFEEVLR